MRMNGFPIGRAWAAALIISSAAPAAAESFTSKNGVTLLAPDVASLDCLALGNLMFDYAVSGYRGEDPIPAGHPDHPIFVYEDRMAQTFYARCQQSGTGYQDASKAFSKGFR